MARPEKAIEYREEITQRNKERGLLSPCHICVSHWKDRDGYSMVKREGRYWRTHQYAWFKKNGVIPVGLCVCHKCDNPSCINPDHLFIGTSSDNTRDRNSKNRQVKGSATGSAKLTEIDVLKIRELLSDGYKPSQICPLYSVCKRTIELIRNGRYWKHAL